eukprot:4641349-Prymnesium_polylepis.1
MSAPPPPLSPPPTPSPSPPPPPPAAPPPSPHLSPPLPIARRVPRSIVVCVFACPLLFADMAATSAKVAIATLLFTAAPT